MTPFTIFTIPKPFSPERTKIIQDNAIGSWLKLTRNVYLLGDEAGTREAADRLGANHITGVAKNEFGTAYLNSALSLVSKESRDNYLIFVNADIVLFSDFLSIFKALPKKKFLVVGQRWDMTVDKKINFHSQTWEKETLAKVRKEALRHPATGSDYFIFPRDSFTNLPNFVVGRSSWDNWMIYEARRKNYAVIDASSQITVLHQTHDYAYYKGPGANVWSGPEAKRHQAIIGNKHRIFDLSDATWEFKDGELFKRKLSLDKWRRYITYTPEVLPGPITIWRATRSVLEPCYRFLKRLYGIFCEIRENVLLSLIR